ncbi:hypothetical protein ACFO9Q_13105 [Paenibacillus sp. GCM10023252]|uniref:hypothetical protein n=1 Tax=Paenibacillus sp. GCM10023252 TaxID=3252649 RepID=UPI00360F81B3
MIKYGLDRMTELRFEQFYPRLELRDGQWVDMELAFQLSEGTPAPDDLIDLTALVICTTDGVIAQIVPQDEGTDCEYQFTVSEKEQITAYVNSEEVQLLISKL